ncbi:LacI family transcriptional regulator [Litorilinea aerophila]|uniref:LacI family transcriptional regulator n=1 Tax=Litorilinea aerophila TaxID=1204385 RepID=A0A540VCI3_9CHLR|nr:LacI family DNA-binding transcriptional regulator [Litorilinea aerophila]MCC9077689.1 LacI family transcriptional regulator [Litorilinea aerophila]
MTNQKRVTIVEVARRARVSAGTVSNALTGKRPVSPATRARILRAIEELGYQPNLLARGLVNRRSGTLGVVVSGLEYYGPSRTLVGIEREANQLGYSLILDLLHTPEADNVEHVLGILTSRRVDGIIWAVHEVGENRAWVSEERLHRLPPIIFLTMGFRPGVAVVTADNRRGACLATRHLLDEGRRRIGLITGPLSWWEARERQAGWQATLEEAGLSPDPSLVVEGDWNAPSGEAGLHRLLEQVPDLDAVFVSNDQMALGVLRAAHLLGRRVPEDLAVVGYDNIPQAPYFWPPLTSVRQQLIRLGSVAVRELQKIIERRQAGQEPGEPVQMALEPELIIRESSRAGAGSG